MCTDTNNHVGYVHVIYSGGKYKKDGIKMKYYRVCERHNVSWEIFISEADKDWYSEEDYILTEIHPTAQQMIELMEDDFESANMHYMRSVPQRLFDVLDEFVPDLTDLLMRKIYEEGVFAI